MRAAVIREFNEDLSLETVADPECPENGVVLEVAACGVCRSDFHGWVGGHPKVSPGSILGHEYCGVVVEAGALALLLLALLAADWWVLREGGRR